MLKRLGFVNVDKGWSWVRGLESKLENEKWNGKVNCSGRKCLWFGVGVNLGFRKDLFKGKDISILVSNNNNNRPKKSKEKKNNSKDIKGK